MSSLVNIRAPSMPNKQDALLGDYLTSGESHWMWKGFRMDLALGDIANLVGGQLNGDAAIPISGAAIIRDANAGDITLADKAQLASQLADCRAAAVLVPPDVTPSGVPFVTVSNVHASFAKIVEHFRPHSNTQPYGVSAAAHISPTARIGRDVVVYPTATIGDDVQIGEGCIIHPGVHILAGSKIGNHVTLFPNVVLYENTVIGDRVIIHAGAAIGAYGFGYDTVDGRHKLSAQLGYVSIADDVEIGAGTTIDRGTYGPTSIGEGTKIDNLVMIAHNCRIGRHNLICSQVGIAGSSTTGDYVVMAGQVGLRDHIDIGDRAILGAKAGIMTSVPADTVYVGIPATADREQFQKQAALAKLPDMRKQFKALQRQVAALAEKLNDAA
ncbi:MAG TPA: UDP-3-O-(3-hydroxymyristoyl)glucosamine N-acyltransferase [Pirellulaceae bacterium]|nr:UDP-3-O-(3-hydroxymyristoyl)glucosamine N-acyltransferase [Pirellulaceae bacterium]